MEHFETPWVVGLWTDYHNLDELYPHQPNYKILTDEVDPWHVALVNGDLPDDEDGAKTAQRICDYHNLVVPALKEAAEFLGHLGFKNEAVERALKAIGAEATTDNRQDHALDERGA